MGHMNADSLSKQTPSDGTGEGETIRLADGRDLGYAEYGDLTGLPVFFFHGTPGSRAFHHPDTTIASELGIRVIVPDRPGYGLSSYDAERTLLDWPSDVVQLADALDIDEFAVIGLSGGGPHALACAATIPERLTHVSVISGMAPLDAPDATDGMSLYNRLGFTIARYAPFLLRPLLSSMATSAQSDPVATVEDAKDRYAEPDQRIMERPEVLSMLAEELTEAYRQGVRGHAQDSKIVSQSWGFDLTDIETMVYLWHGSLDENAPIAMGKHIAETVPDTVHNCYASEGHLLFFDHWGEILSTIQDRR